MSAAAAGSEHSRRKAPRAQKRKLEATSDTDQRCRELQAQNMQLTGVQDTCWRRPWGAEVCSIHQAVDELPEQVLTHKHA